MHLRLALYDLGRRHRLDAAALRALNQAAALDDEPTGLAGQLPRGLAVLAAAFVGLGLIFWVAANWASWPRWGRFGLLQAFVVLMAAAALLRPAARAPLALVAMLGIGGLFAFFGQTYQTGADAWQLFAWWAALSLPLAIGVRSDVLWAPWVLVAFTAVSLWVAAHTGHRWQATAGDTGVYLVGWLVALGLIAALAAPWRRVTGAGAWSLRVAATLFALMVGATALIGLFSREVAALYGLGLLVLGVAAAAQSRRELFDVFVASAVALTLCTLLVAGLVRLLFDNHRGQNSIGSLLLVGLVAAGLLAAAVKLLLIGQRRSEAGAAA